MFYHINRILLIYLHQIFTFSGVYNIFFKNLSGREDIKLTLLQYFTQKGQKFFELGILNLLKRWKKVIEQNGQYIID